MKRKSYVVQGLMLSNVRVLMEYFLGQFYIDASINRREDIIEIRVVNKLNVKQEDGNFKEELVESYIDTKQFNERWKGKMKILIHIQN